MPEHSETYFVYPPWASYTFAWRDLPHLFPFPEKYALAAGVIPLARPGHWPAEMKKHIDLGYSVSQQDHRFIDGPEGGGLIAVKRDVRRWFPKVLMIPQCKFGAPPGFDRHSDYGVFILVPNVRASHRLGEVATPLAPSPLFSVEQLAEDDFQCVFALSFDTKDVAVEVKPPLGFAALDVRVEPISETPECARGAFEKIDVKQRYYAWYRILHSRHDVRALIAVAVYLGLAVAARANGSLRAMHVFCSMFLHGIEYPSATKWQQSIRRIRMATDW